MGERCDGYSQDKKVVVKFLEALNTGQLRIPSLFITFSK